MRHGLTSLLSVLICAAGAWGQTSVSTSGGTAGGFSGTFHFGAPMPFMTQGIKGAPYSAEEVIEQVQTLADGTHITQQASTTKMYRDSQGRTRTERPVFRGMLLPNGQVPDSPLVVEIMDPVNRVKYTLDTVNKVAHRQQVEEPAVNANAAASGMPVSKGVLGGALGPVPVQAFRAPDSQAAPAGDGTRPQNITEKLGTQTIEGVPAQGFRHTTVFPVGSLGNDRPISVTRETWFSQDLRMMVLSKSSDPRSGEHTQRLTNISLSEPSASLFQPPPEYTVVDENGPFDVKWGSRK